MAISGEFLCHSCYSEVIYPPSGSSSDCSAISYSSAVMLPGSKTSCYGRTWTGVAPGR